MLEGVQDTLGLLIVWVLQESLPLFTLHPRVPALLSRCLMSNPDVVCLECSVTGDG